MVRGPTIQTKMSLVTAGTDCTVSQHLLRCGGKLFHSLGLAAAKALSSKMLWVRVTTRVRLSVERSHRLRASATRRQSSVKCDAEFPEYRRYVASIFRDSETERLF